MTWHKVEEKEPPKDKPFLAKLNGTFLDSDFPAYQALMWLEEGIYGNPEYFECNGEYCQSLDNIIEWTEIPG